MNLLTMRTELSERVRAYDETVSSDATILNRWINLAQDEVSSEADWDFLRAFDIIQTVIDVTAGTITISANATTATLSATNAISMKGRFLQVVTSNDWYEITAHTAGTDSLTIDPAFVSSSELSSGTYTIRKLFYGVSSTIEKLEDIKQLISPQRFKSLSKRSFDMLLPLTDSTGTPWFYNLATPDSSGNLQFSLYPTPDTVMNLNVLGIIKMTDLSLDTDTSVVPKKYHNVILDKAAEMALRTLDDTRSKEYQTAYLVGIGKMKDLYEADQDRHRVIKSLDDHSPQGIAFTLPAQFGPMSHG